jgi:DNA repair protein RecN (Recombination protein N)
VLRELHISNLAVISDARIELGTGLNCFTGATGAGKSLVIGALEVLLGLRSPAEMLRPGVDEGRVSGVFEAGNPDLLQKIRAVTDVDVAADGGELLLTRRLYASGRSSVSLNGNPITLAMLKQVSENLVDVHGQHDHQYLLKPANQADVIDQFGGLGPLRQSYHETYQKVVTARQRLADLSAGRALREQQLELYRFQANEIDSAALDPDEYEQLSSRASVLQNLEKLKKDAGGAHAALYDADDAVLDRLKTLSGTLEELSELDVNLKSVSNGLRDAAIQVEEIAFDLSRYLDKLDLDPAELAETSDRLNTINRVLNKYGGARAPRATDKSESTARGPASDIQAALAYRRQIGDKIAELERATDDFTTLAEQIRPLLADLKRRGEELTTRRTTVAAKIGPLIEMQLTDLGMEKAKFAVTLSPAVGAIAGEGLPATPSGFDVVEFVAQTNPGQLTQPLRKIASGGELSRIMLALKGVLASSDRISVLVFDEIDANVGGRLGSIIGSKLRALASHHQVLCITHLPQIASYADRHLTVRKEVAGGVTETKVRLMEGQDRLQELAEMIGGQRVTDTTRAQAQELLDSARLESRHGPGTKPSRSAKPGRNGKSVKAPRGGSGVAGN